MYIQKYIHVNTCIHIYMHDIEPSNPHVPCALPCCSVLYGAAARCSMLQCVAV